jgi:4-carboxymuconolactone decarboxylase
MRDDVRALVALSATIAQQDPELLETALAEAGQRAAVQQVEEALLQSYLFVGYPAALQAIARWREMSGRPAPLPAAGDWTEWAARGADVCSRVYGGQYARLRENVRALHPDMEQWMVVEGYGKVLGRPGLPLAARELCIVALLAVQRAPQQLYSHLRGALQVGASEQDVEEALALAGAVSGAERAALASQVWQKVRARSASGE